MLMADKDYKGAANRSYYTAFHCMRAVLAMEEVDFSKHSGVISYFRKEFIKTGKFPKEVSVWISELFDLRSMSDYNDFYIASKEEVNLQIERAEKLLQLTEKYLEDFCKSEKAKFE